MVWYVRFSVYDGIWVGFFSFAECIKGFLGEGGFLYKEKRDGQRYTQRGRTKRKEEKVNARFPFDENMSRVREEKEGLRKREHEP